MSTPAGWYDDGSGRQRWWDGQQWTDQFAPDAVAPSDTAPAQVAAPAVEVVPKQMSTLGFVGLGLAVLGTVLVCIPTFVTFGIGSVVLLAALVVSLIAVFKKGTVKWPPIVGIALSVVGGIVGVVVLAITIATAVAGFPVPSSPTDLPTSATSEQPSDPPSVDDGEGRPAPEAIGEGFKTLLHDAGITDYDDKPEFFSCIGQYLYDSDMSDEALWSTVDAEDLTGPEREEAIQIGIQGTLTCDPQ